MQPLSSIAITALVVVVACGSPAAPRTATPPAPAATIALRPSLTVGEQLRFHVATTIETTISADGRTESGRAGFELDDEVEVVAPSQVRECITNAVLRGDGQLAQQLAAGVAALSNAILTTTFGERWEVASSTVDGTQDQDARTLLTDLMPAVSFGAIPMHAVAVGNVWRNERGPGSGTVALRYALKSVGPCKPGTCAVIIADGEQPMAPQNGATGTEHFHGEQTVDVATSLPLVKTVVSTTIGHGEQAGKAFQLVNTVTVRIERVGS